MVVNFKDIYICNESQNIGSVCLFIVGTIKVGAATLRVTLVSGFCRSLVENLSVTGNS